MAAARQHVGEHGTSDYPDVVVFEERDGIYWVRECDFGRLRTGVERSAVRAGFDHEGFVAEALALMRRGLRVALRRGDSLRMLRVRAARQPRRVDSTPLFLAPVSLVEQRELANLGAAMERPNCRLRSCFEDWRACLSGGTDDSVALYVYELSGGMYEVDWQLTELSETSFRCLALAAHTLGRRLNCRLVSPHRQQRVRRVVRQEKAVVYGQLGLGL